CVSERRPCSVTSLADGVTLRSLPPPRIKIEDVIPRRAERGRPDFANRDLGENLPRLRLAPVVGAVADGPWPDRVVVAAVRGKCSGVRCALGGIKGSGDASDGRHRQTARSGLFFCLRRQFKGYFRRFRVFVFRPGDLLPCLYPLRFTPNTRTVTPLEHFRRIGEDLPLFRKRVAEGDTG